MNQIEVIFLPSFPEDLQEDLMVDLGPLLPLLSREISKLFVEGEIEDEGNVAEIAVRRQYHKANLHLGMEFFTYDALRRQETLLHEFFHILLDPLTTEIGRVILRFVEDERLQGHLMQTISDAEERVVEGLALSFGEIR